MKTHFAYLIILSICILTVKAQKVNPSTDWLPIEKENTHPLQHSPKLRKVPGSYVHDQKMHEAAPGRKSINGRFSESREPEMPTTTLLSSWERRQLNRQANCSFYGTRFPVYYDSRTYFRTTSRPQDYQISQHWRQIENSRYDLLLKQISRQARNLQLNDWGLGQLIHQTASGIYPNDRNAQILFQLFAFSKMGYSARVCQEGSQLYLMLPANQVIYGATYLREGSRKFYLLDFGGRLPDVRRAKMVNLNYSRTGKALDFEINQAPKFPVKPITRRLQFDYKGKRYDYTVRLNRNLIHYYASYPFTNLDIRFGAPLSAEARYSLLPQLRASMRGMNQTEAVNFLLRFVQKSFGYQTDTEQFGRERYLFAEQTLYFANSDCEDRSALFAYLVKEILGLDTIGLLFPGHVATAVRFTQPAQGSYYKYRGAKYFVCDPTYINATYGMVIPDVRHKNATVIRF